MLAIGMCVVNGLIGFIFVLISWLYAKNSTTFMESYKLRCKEDSEIEEKAKNTRKEIKEEKKSEMSQKLVNSNKK